MRIGLVDVDGKWPNLALMKLSAYHKDSGDQVEWFLPLMRHWYERVYASKLFTDTPDADYLPDDAVRGGTGYGVPVQLPDSAELMSPDYSIYPDYKRDIGFLTRGCLRACPWCVVPKFEGKLRQVDCFETIWTGRSEICFLDNNILGMKPLFYETVEKAKRHGVKISFNQGLDIRLLCEESARVLAGMPTYEGLHFGFDDMAYAEDFRAGCGLLRKHGLIGRTVFLFLVGFGACVADDIERLKVAVQEKAGVYFMFYNRGRDLRAPWGDVDFFLHAPDIRAPVGNLRKYRRLVTTAMTPA